MGALRKADRGSWFPHLNYLSQEVRVGRVGEDKQEANPPPPSSPSHRTGGTVSREFMTVLFVCLGERIPVCRMILHDLVEH